MGKPGKTSDHSIDIVLGGSRSNIAGTLANRAGTPVRQMNNNNINQTEMGQMPFQNDAIANAQGMKGLDVAANPVNPVVNPNIPGTLPGSGNVPGNQQIPNPVARLKKSNPPQPTQKPETEEFKRAWQKYQEELKTDPVLQQWETEEAIKNAFSNNPKIHIDLPQERGITPFEEDEEFVD